MTTHTGDSLYEKLKHVKVGSNICQFSLDKCNKIAPIINEINELKRKKNAIILGHSYISPEIILGVADYVGDSYELSKKAKESNADTIIFAAVKFMAETAKLLNPSKKVFVPSSHNGCSLADSITKAQVQQLKRHYPDYTFVCYINTTTAVKSECDVCVTSSNVYDIIGKIDNPKIYFLPDKLMALNVIEYAHQHYPHKTIKYWDGTCYVHEEYDSDMIKYLKSEHPNLLVLAHPECSPNVTKASDFVGSTSQMINHVKDTNAESYFMLTECGLTSRVQLELPQKKFIGSCTMCQFMKSNSLKDIRDTLLHYPKEKEITIPQNEQRNALECINEMFRYVNTIPTASL